MKFVKHLTLLLIVCLSCGSHSAVAKKLNILTTTATLASVAQSVGGAHVKVESIIKGSQDPHYLEAKPSYMVKARRADLLILNGLDLEVGWLPNIILGARHPRILKGRSGYLDASQFIEPMDVVEGKVDRSKGDIHPFGNPHFMLDPLNAVRVAKGFAGKFSQLDPAHKQSYMEQARQFEQNIQKKTALWFERIKTSKIKKVITYHKDLDYILNHFHLKLEGSIENKPGIPPTAKHLMAIRNRIKSENIYCILVNTYIGKPLLEKVNRKLFLLVQTVPVEVLAHKNAVNYEALVEYFVQAVENCGKQKAKEVNRQQVKKQEVGRDKR